MSINFNKNTPSKELDFTLKISKAVFREQIIESLALQHSIHTICININQEKDDTSKSMGRDSSLDSELQSSVADGVLGVLCK